ncbi:TPA: hypothetical protein DCL30_04060 [Candidatus Peribacteria bacterium]|nr:MAG: hypothetical protein A3J91_01930 [Candidatus Peribacteria bacterium RIFOXYC2_FULL_58_10]OGJ83711.1 MAG: hypothetical protein A2529_01360 [Candidatus Peribacteria bacterium RIFOXYD2_FULL_58_15]HAI98679.1 hypothetical protein [Candidatus Peribacteria bacterium]HAS34392.1 hypothetical protein [Candidatus Peribacteria bacterium]
MNHGFLRYESLCSIEKRSPFLPRARVVVGTVLATAALFFLSRKVLAGIAPFDQIPGMWLLGIFAAFAVVACVLELKWLWVRDEIFAFIVGTGIAFTLLAFQKVLFGGEASKDPFIMALGIVCVVILWRALFGPWSARIKATVLGTFILWIALHVLFRETPQERLTHLLAAVVALIPAALWCWLFIEYHTQRWSMVLLMFFAGMLSTAPILFYDALVRNGIELQFFLFKIVPQNFSYVSDAFVSGTIVSASGVRSTVLTTLLSFLIVGFIEEVSKFWVTKESGKPFFTSIDDVIQLAIIVAIGFAFAENILNPTYFIGFVREFLVDPPQPQWWAFLANVSGRAILTTMVHIVSSGIMGYFLGLAIFARSYLEDGHRRGKWHLIPDTLQYVLKWPEKRVFAFEMIVVGLVLATVLHGLFNFMVTLPDILPGNPQTLGALFGADTGSFLHSISLLILPSLLYVVGGFWMFTALFYRKDNMKERGRVITTDSFVSGRELP